MISLSPLSRARWNRFRNTRRAYWSLWILGLAFGISLFAELWIHEKPLLIQDQQGTWRIPQLELVTDQDLGGIYQTEADWVQLRAQGFQTPHLDPLIPWGPLPSDLQDDQPPYAPSTSHWLGTDASGRDLLARLVYGFRTGMLFSLCLAFLGTLGGLLIGGIQGYFGGRTDLIFQRFIEIWAALPFLYVVILIAHALGTSFGLLVAATAAFQWIGLSYYIRSEVFRIRSLAYVRSADALGMGHFHKFFREILPNAMTPVITFLPFQIIGGIGTLTALDFLGFGLRPPTASWGELLNQGLQNLHAPWLAGFTVLALMTTLLLCTFIGEGLREAFDPKGGEA
jgi:microcin C transport system permease protein